VSSYTYVKHAHRRRWADFNNVDAVNEFISLCENLRSVIVPTQMMWRL
jgi:protein tyrosine phosphatase